MCDDCIGQLTITGVTFYVIITIILHSFQIHIIVAFLYVIDITMHNATIRTEKSAPHQYAWLDSESENNKYSIIYLSLLLFSHINLDQPLTPTDFVSLFFQPLHSDTYVIDDQTSFVEVSLSKPPQH